MKIASLCMKSLADSQKKIQTFFEKCLADYELITTPLSTEASLSSNEKLVLFMLLNEFSQKEIDSRNFKLDIHLFTFNQKINQANIECFLYDNILETKLRKIHIVNTFKGRDHSEMSLTEKLENSVCIEIDNIPLSNYMRRVFPFKYLIKLNYFCKRSYFYYGIP